MVLGPIQTMLRHGFVVAWSIRHLSGSTCATRNEKSQNKLLGISSEDLASFSNVPNSALLLNPQMHFPQKCGSTDRNKQALQHRNN